eukprot:scaffold114775_cov59-Phaeocystis_antarctica.AAC.2
MGQARLRAHPPILLAGYAEPRLRVTPALLSSVRSTTSHAHAVAPVHCALSTRGDTVGAATPVLLASWLIWEAEDVVGAWGG